MEEPVQVWRLKIFSRKQADEKSEQSANPPTDQKPEEQQQNPEEQQQKPEEQQQQKPEEQQQKPEEQQQKPEEQQQKPGEQQQKPEDLPACKDSPPCKSCRYVKSKTCGSTDENLKCKKPPPTPESGPSLLSLKNSVTANCYSCCCNLKEFFIEVFKAIGGDPNNRVCDILGDMTDLLLALANDLVLFLRKICNCFSDSMPKKC